MKKKLQKGLSLIEASMVLVLSAVVVAGVMVYYQTAQKNNQLDKFSTQIMHIISEINGLYAGGKKLNGGTDYSGMNTSTILAAVNDAEPVQIGGTNGKSKGTAIKTAFPNTSILISGAKQTATSPIAYSFTATGADHFALTLEGMDVTSCQKMVGMNFGPQLEGIQISGVTSDGKHSFSSQEFVSVSEPVSERFKKCQEIVSKNQSKSGMASPTIAVILIMK
jgi:type II secretory pathway pseudopilin PulG